MDQGAAETGKEIAMNCWNSLLQEITRTNTAGSTEHPNMMEAWPWSWPVTSRLKHIHVKTWTAREGNADGQSCKVPDAFNRSQPATHIPSYTLEDARERCRVRRREYESASTGVCCGDKRVRTGRDQTSRADYALSYSQSLSWGLLSQCCPQEAFWACSLTLRQHSG